MIAQSSAQQSVILVTAQPLDPAALARVAGVAELRCVGAEAHFQTGNATQTLSALMAFLVEQGAEVVDLQVRKASLEDVFLKLTHAEGAEPSFTPTP